MTIKPELFPAIRNMTFYEVHDIETSAWCISDQNCTATNQLTLTTSKTTIVFNETLKCGAICIYIHFI